MNCTSNFGLWINIFLGQCLQLAEIVSWKHDNTLATKTSFMKEKFWPMQFWGPKEKGMKLCWCWQAFKTPLVNLLGSNSITFSPYSLGSWCIWNIRNSKTKLLGTKMSPSCISFDATLVNYGRISNNWCTLFNIIPIDSKNVIWKQFEPCGKIDS
jgi:hypothetical protein